MKAMRVESQGGPEVRQVVELPPPPPGKGEALVRVEAAGVNFIDIYQRNGLDKVALPFTLGQEGAGTVEVVGPGVTEVRAGERVAWTSVLGSYATHQIVPAWRLVPVPAKLDAQTAPAVMLQGMTAHYLINDTFPLPPGHVCPIHAPPGCPGPLLFHLARPA